MMNRSNMSKQMSGGAGRAKGTAMAADKSAGRSSAAAGAGKRVQARTGADKGMAMAAQKSAGRGSDMGQKMRGYAKGGSIDGIAQRGKTRGKMC